MCSYFHEQHPVTRPHMTSNLTSKYNAFANLIGWVGYERPSRAELPSRAAEPELPSWIFLIRVFVKVKIWILLKMFLVISYTLNKSFGSGIILNYAFILIFTSDRGMKYPADKNIEFQSICSFRANEYLFRRV